MAGPASTSHMCGLAGPLGRVNRPPSLSKPAKKGGCMKSVVVAGLVMALGFPQLALAQQAAPAPAPAPAAASAPPSAQSPADPSTPAAAPKKPDDTLFKIKRYFLARPKEQPSRLERLLVAGGATVVAVAGVGIGVGFGLWALSDYLCLRDVNACADRPIAARKLEGTNFLQARLEGERKALAADMGYLMAATFTAVAALGYASAFWPSGWWPFQNEEVLDAEPLPGTAAPAPAPAAAPATDGGAK
jgi:hypothetical protein